MEGFRGTLIFGGLLRCLVKLRAQHIALSSLLQSTTQQAAISVGEQRGRVAEFVEAAYMVFVDVGAALRRPPRAQPLRRFAPPPLTQGRQGGTTSSDLASLGHCSTGLPSPSRGKQSTEQFSGRSMPLKRKADYDKQGWKGEILQMLRKCARFQVLSQVFTGLSRGRREGITKLSSVTTCPNNTKFCLRECLCNRGRLPLCW